jgi:hypothetical protein
VSLDNTVQVCLDSFEPGICVSPYGKLPGNLWWGEFDGPFRVYATIRDGISQLRDKLLRVPVTMFVCCQSASAQWAL